MPAYWLGAFFNPRGLLALLKLETMRSYSNDRSWTFEPFVFQTEVTSRDKDHVSSFHHFPFCLLIVCVASLLLALSVFLNICLGDSYCSQIVVH